MFRRFFTRIIKRLLKIKRPSARLEYDYSGKVVGNIVNRRQDDKGITVSVAMKDLPEDPVMQAIRAGQGLKPLQINIERYGKTERYSTALRWGYCADNRLMESGIPLNEMRQIEGEKPCPPTTDTNVTKAHRKRCEYCGVISERDYGTCAHCGAPL